MVITGYLSDDIPIECIENASIENADRKWGGVISVVRPKLTPPWVPYKGVTYISSCQPLNYEGVIVT